MDIDMKHQKKLEQTYLTLSFMSGIVELGSIVLMIAISNSLVKILITGLFYQIGNLLSSTVRLSKKKVQIILFVALLFSIAFYFYETPFFLYFTIGIASWGIQKMRRLTKVLISDSSPVSTFTKRLVRIGGFLIAGIVTTKILRIVIGGLLLIAIDLALSTNIDWRDAPPILKPKRSHLSDIMTIHQSHYFSYAYLIPIVLIMNLGVPAQTIGALFIIGWISYIYSEQLLGKYESTSVFILGHILVTFSLISIWLFSESLTGVLLFWFLSGFGGGTVFCIKRLNKYERTINKVRLDIWEDIGHVLGVVIVIFVGWILDLHNGIDAFLISAMIAIITASLMLWYRLNLVYNGSKS